MMRFSNTVFCCFLGLVFGLPLLGGLPASSERRTGAASASQQLQSLFAEEWESELRDRPEMATALGDNRYNDRLSHHSPERYQSEAEQSRKFLVRFEAISPAGLSPQDTLSRELMIRRLREEIEGIQFKPWEMPVNQMGGPHLSLVELVTITPFKNVKDYDNYLSRLHQIPRMLDQVMANMRQGVRDRLMPPRYLLDKVTVQADEIASKASEGSPFAKPVAKFPEDIPAAEQERLRKAVLTAINSEIVPTYQKFATFLRVEYVPHGRTEPGVWALPDGEAIECCII